MGRVRICSPELAMKEILKNWILDAYWMGYVLFYSDMH